MPEAPDFSTLISDHLAALEFGLIKSCERLAIERETDLRGQINKLQQENQKLQRRLDLEFPLEKELASTVASTALVIDGVGKSPGSMTSPDSPDSRPALRPSMTNHDVKFELLPEYLADDWVEADQECADEGFYHWIEATDPHALISRSAMCVVIDPTSGRRLIWDMLGIPILAWDIITIPLGVFDIGDFGAEVLSGAGWVTLIFWTIDLPLSFLTGFFGPDGILIMGLKPIGLNYIRGSFPLDLIIVLADWGSILLKDVSAVAENVAVLRMFRITRFARLLRLRKLKAKMHTLEDSINSEWLLVVMSLMCKIATILMFTHYVACAWAFIGSQDIFDVPSRRWLTSLPYPQYDSNGVKMADAEWAYQYLTSLHWALAQFTPGPQNIQPQNCTERIFAVFILLLGLVVFSSFIAGVTQARMQLSKMVGKLDRDLWILRKFCKQKHVSRELTLRMKRYIDLVIVPNFHKLHTEDVILLPKLSAHLRAQLNKELVSQILCVHPFFENLKNKHDGVFNSIANDGSLDHMSLARGDVAFGSGQEAHSLLLVSDGILDYIAVSGNKEDAPQQVAKGDWVSEAVLWTKWIHQGQCQASVESTAMLVNSARLQKELLENGPVMGFVRKYGQEFIKRLNTLAETTGSMPTDIHSHLGKDINIRKANKVAFLWKSSSKGF